MTWRRADLASNAKAQLYRHVHRRRGRAHAVNLGAPTTTTQNVAIYDFIKGQTVLATVTSGGNPGPAQAAPARREAGGNWTLPFLTNSTFMVEYFRNRSFNTTNSFPLLTAEVEAAFPGRVTRNANGDIISVDESPVTFAREESNSLRYGINLAGSFGTPDPAMARSRMGMMRGIMPPPGGRGGPPGGPGGPGGRAGGRAGGPGGPRGPGSRWSRRLRRARALESLADPHDHDDEPGPVDAQGTVYDLLGGSALSSTGVARHSIELEGGGFYRSFGLRVSGTYTGGARADSGTSNLDFHPIAKVNVRLFADLGRRPGVVRAVPFLKNARFSLSVNNLFNAIQKVTDQNGEIPLRYQAGYLDPVGRLFKVEFRKQF
jgi:hypothetical protein